MPFARFHVVHPYSSIDTFIDWKKSCTISYKIKKIGISLSSFIRSRRMLSHSLAFLSWWGLQLFKQRSCASKFTFWIYGETKTFQWTTLKICVIEKYTSVSLILFFNMSPLPAKWTLRRVLQHLFISKQIINITTMKYIFFIHYFRKYQIHYTTDIFDNVFIYSTYWKHRWRNGYRCKMAKLFLMQIFDNAINVLLCSYSLTKGVNPSFLPTSYG